MAAFVAFLANVYLGQFLPTIPLPFILLLAVTIGVLTGALIGPFLGLDVRIIENGPDYWRHSY